MARHLPGLYYSPCRAFHAAPLFRRQHVRHHPGASFPPGQTASRLATQNTYQDPWKGLESFGHPPSIKPQISANRKLQELLAQRVWTFSQLDQNANFAKTLKDLGLLSPPIPLGRNSGHKQLASWKGQLENLAKEYTTLILRAMDHRRSLGSTPELKIWREMVSDCITQQANRFDLEGLDCWIISNFVTWAASKCRISSANLRPDSNRIVRESSTDLALGAFLSSLSSLIDMRRPHDKYPDARRYKRQIHLHVGPTNSGKTHSALRALHGANTGVYAGPLRLLAHEVFTRMNEGQIANDLAPRACNLITGEEHRTVDVTAGLTSCTVEMLSPHQYYDVVVIDEIQMIGDVYRGDAWTQAVLGTQAKELHLCGEESVVELIIQLAENCGDEFILHRYERLTPLKVSDQSLHSDLSKVQQGDCIVTFSRSNIYAIKKFIQEKTNLRVGMAYGGLPPEVREREARMFNVGAQVEGEGGYDVLVGSDAIGMGLNLKIKRVIFEALHKYDGRKEVALSTSQIKQIGGRAGRYGVLTPKPKSSSEQNFAKEPPSQSIGEVCTLQESEMPLLRECMSAPFHPIHQAVIKAPFETVEGLARLVPPGVRFSTLLGLRRTLTVTSPIFAIGDEKNAAGIADMLEGIGNLSLSERDLFCSSPANTRNLVAMNALKTWATAHAKRVEADFHAWLRHENLANTVSSIQDFASPSSSSSYSSEQKMRTKERLVSQTLLRLESLHKCLVLYLWLGFRLPETFTAMAGCSEWKTKTEDALALGLHALSHHRHHNNGQLDKSCLLKATIAQVTTEPSVAQQHV